MTIKTRFAPSPTGFLHIGGARTALFNYLFAKNNGGEFLLRIEDTDIKRSTKEAKQAIIDSLRWLGIDYDGEVIYQSKSIERHKEVAQQLLDSGRAYYCFSSQEEIAKLREEALAKKEHFIFHSPWRDAKKEDYPTDQKPVIRIKASSEGGESVIKDHLQGEVRVQNSHLDDMVLVRADGTPTYMLAVVVDDHDMEITHIIRGDDHLNNAFRQKLIYDAMGWKMPEMVHIPLIHGPDGAKLSKRHGALGTHEYANMGYLPEAINNYLLRLGWSHGDDEIISRKQAIEWFNLKGLGKSPSRLDFDKMQHINAHYLRNYDNKDLAGKIYQSFISLRESSKNNILKAIDLMKPRAQLVTDLQNMAVMFLAEGTNLQIEDDAQEIIDESDPELINEVKDALKSLEVFDLESVKQSLKEVALSQELKLGSLMKYVRAFVTGRVNSPSVFEIMVIIGKEESLKRLG
ncbi:MAG: hypothetical protein DGJ47_000215 [Rickettsiaceae bacterium]